MRRRVWLAGTGAILAAGILAFGVLRWAGAHDPHPSPTADICDSLTDQECDAAIQGASDAFFSKLAQWRTQFSSPPYNLRPLPRYPGNSLYDPPQPTLSAALDHADLVVLATASAVRFDSDAVLGARVTLKIERTLKGSTSPTLEIPMGGGPEPAGTWEEVILGYEENAPLLLPGDRAVLFLEYDERTKSYGV